MWLQEQAGCGWSSRFAPDQIYLLGLASFFAVNSRMAKLVFDIETSALPLENFDEAQQEYLFRELEKMGEEPARAARREEILRQFNLWPFTAQVVCIAMLNADTQRGQVLFLAEDFDPDEGEAGPVEFFPCADEVELLTAFWDVAKHYEEIATFNGRGFDVPFLYLRSALLNVLITKKNWLGYRFQTEPHCDLAEQFTFYNVSGREGAARRFNLDFYCKAFGIDSPKSHGVTGMDVNTLLAEGRHRDIAEYCLRERPRHRATLQRVEGKAGGDKMKQFRIAFAILLLGLPPIGSYLSAFIMGYFCESYGASFEGSLFFIFIAPIFIGIAIGCLVPVKRIISRVGIGLGSIFLSGFLALFGVPAGAITYSHGFEHALRTKVGIERLQHWSQETLGQYQNGQIKSAGEPSYWNPGDILISTNELPEFLKTGIFKLNGVYNFGPEVSICKSGGKIGIGQNCVAISWYLHGVLVGSSNFTNHWNPWYSQEIAPGVYSYHGMK